MILFERKAIDWITEHKEILFFLCISVLAGLLRVCEKILCRETCHFFTSLV